MSEVMDTKGRILVVEDDANLLEGIRTVLVLDGYDVVTAENGAIALNWMQQTPRRPDLIVSDIMMPQMDGIEFLKQVRAVNDWVSIPFIFLTARSEKADVQLGKQLGVDDHLPKPFEADDLLSTVSGKMKRLRAIRSVHEEQISDVKKKILTILNHEFRTPLTFVVAYSDLLNVAREDSAEMNDEEMLSFLKGINLGAVRLRRLIENFIMLVELETGDARTAYQLRCAPVRDLPGLLDRARTVALDGRGDRQIVLQPLFDLPEFYADSDYLLMSLVQLLDNALKFSPADSVIEVGAETAGDAVRVWVRDHGRGIPPDELENIWTSFYQVNRAIHEDPGAGSGLAIVKGIMTLHNGRATVTSEYGRGSTFSLFFPLGAR